ncbi:Ig-like domain-containing protein [Flavobacterium sp.]|uniref:Ig-like domain-containing protein n=1 Tax=Flavobacterium sp. TaxID=239 RepID=UPI003D1034F9
MRNFTLSQSKLFRLISLVLLFVTSISSFAQVCGTPGADGPVTVLSSINTYYPISGNITLNAGAQSILLAGVPPIDRYSNNFGSTQISAGDLILIIQMQDATIDSSNSPSYGSGTTNSGPDGLGGTGFTSIGNTGVFEYVIATNNVPLTGGNLTFKGTGTGGGILNSFYNADATSARGKRTFQIVRVPQYSNLTLNSDITTPPFNGIAGGVIAFNVSGTFNFNSKIINGTARGFRGGYSPKADSGVNNSTIYVGLSTNNKISGKGEGMAGTPRFMWDGFNEVDNIAEGMPGGSAGRGAAANAGGGGNDHNTGGGGGGNGGFGGLGGAGWQGGGGDLYPAYTGGGRPGFKSYTTATPFPRLVMGGGGGAGDANNASSGVKGGVGGAIILINAGTVQGTGYINANGGNGAAGTYSGSPDGAGGGGAGGTVLLNISNNSTANITINANGGNGGNSENDSGNEHGPGGGGGGGIISHNLSSSSTITSSVNGGLAGKSNAGAGINHGAVNGTIGYVTKFTVSDVPTNLQVNANCFPSLETKVKSLSTASACNSIGEKVSYEIQIKNTGAGNAAGVVLDFSFPAGIEFDSATATYSIEASGPLGPLTNINTTVPNNPLLGMFNIGQNGVVTITLIGKVAASISPGAYSSNAQALYLDPTRTTANSTRKITAATNAYGTVNKKYEGANQADVSGVNFSGSSTNLDDITILALPAVPTFMATQPTCTLPTGTIRVDTPANGTGINYTLTGTNPVTAPVNNATGIFSGLVAGIYKLTTTNSQGCTSLSTADITINALAGAPTTTGVSICQGDDSVALVATSTCSSGTIQWYTAASGGTLLYTGVSFNPVGVAGSGLADTNTAKTVIYYAACTGSTCRTATSFVIKPKPTITSTTPNSRCDAGTVTLGATASSGTINWYAAATGGPSLGTGATFTTPSLSVTTDFYVDATDNGCTTVTRTPVKATVNTSPTINSTIEGSRCGTGTVALSATASTGSTIYWYANPTGGPSLETGATFNTPSLSATTTYYVGATTTEGCTTASRIAVAAVINTASTVVLTSATSTQNQTLCEGTPITSTVYTFGGSATNAVASNLPLGLGSIVDTNAKTITISGSPTTSGPYTYTITTVGHTSPCSAATINANVTVTANNTVSAASTTPTLCINTVLTNITHTTSGATGIGSATGLPAGVTAAWASNKITISGTPTVAGIYTYRIPLVGGCGTVLNATGKITITAAPNAGTLSGTQNICVAGTTTFTSTGDSGSWSSSNNAIATVNPSTGLVTGVTAGTATITYTVTGTGGCTNATANRGVTITAAPNAGTLSGTQNICVAGTTTFASTGDSGNWSSSNNAIATVNPSTGLVTGVTAGTATITYTVTGTGGCTNATATRGVTITAAPNAGTLSGTQNICVAGTTTFVSTGDSGSWSSSNNAIATVNPSTGLVTGVTAGTATITYTVTGTGGCTNATANRGVTITAAPNAGTLSGTQNICVAGTTTFASTGDSGNWSSSNNAIATVNPSTGLVTGVTAGTATITYTVTGTGGCTNATATRGVTITAAPNAGTLSGTQNICVAGTTTFVSTGDSGNWSSSNNAIATVNPSTGLVTGVTAGTATITYTVTGTGGCTNATATRGVTITAAPNAGTLSGTQNICVAGTTTFASTGDSGNWSSSNNAIATVNPSTGLVTGVTAGTATITYTVTGTGGCTNATTTREVTITAAPNAGTLSGTQNICVAGTTTFTSTGDSGNWSSSNNAIATVDPSTGLVTGVTAGTATITYTVTGTGGCTNTTATRDVTITAAPNAGTLSGTQNICVAGTTTFVSTGDSGNWSSSNNAIATVDPLTGLVTGVTAGTATITYTVTGTGGCTNATTSRTITIKPIPSVPVLSSVIEQTCTVAKGSVTIINYDIIYTYIITPSTGVVQNGAEVIAPVGSYTITASANGCISDSSSFTINSKICAKDDNTYAVQVPGTTVATTVGNVTTNDTLNGTAVTALNTTVTAITTGPLSIDANGVLTLDPNTASGSYSITYEICEKGATPANCDTATATVVVKGTLDAKDDNTYAVQVPGTTVATTVGNVTTNDTLNGTAVTALNTTVTPISTGPLSIDANGVLTLDPNTASGSYSITYEICEKGATPANCDTATATVVVKGTLDAKDDNTYAVQVPGTTVATTVGNVTTNDTLNGTAVTSTNTTVTAITTGPLSIDANGVLTLDPNTASGSYSITYEICEKGATPANCDTATVTVVVKGTLDAKDDNTYAVQVPGTTVATTVGNVTTNDTLNGTAVTALNTTVTPISTGPLSIDASGVLTLEPNTASGSYSITYEICEKGATPANCDTATATVVVKGTLDAKDDNTYAVQVPGTTVATTVGNVTTNDTLNGTAVTSTNTTVTAITTGPLSIDANGVLTLEPNTASGSYSITYEICEKGANPANCDTATATVVVKGTLDAKDDNTYAVQVPGTTVATTVGNVTTNDTLNGTAVTSTNTTVTAITTGPLSIDANGVLTLEPNTASGSYSITYEICEKGANPANCDTATATVVVKGTLDAKDDNTYAVQVPGTTVATTVGNVTTNDTLNGTAVTSTNTTVTAITTGPLSIDANGVLTLEPNTASGSYSITYEICEKGANPANCDTATATVVVKGTLDAKDDNTYAVQVPGTTVATTVGNVTTNDTLNGTAVTSTNTTVTAITTGPLSIDANGVLTLEPNTASGSYSITYEICEKGATPANCDTATATVVVKGTLDAKDDNTYAVQVPGTTVATTVGNVTTNDTLNGTAVTSTNTTVTAITTGPLSIDTNGVLTLDPNTASGSYSITYEICEKGATPANCDTATATVVVKGTLDAKGDNTYAVQVPGTTVATTVGNVTTNDTLNGTAVTALNTTVTAITTGPLSIDANGVLTLEPNTASGSYSITYEICEKGATPANCDTATATVVVKGTLDAKDDNTYAVQVPGTTVATTVGNVTTNDTLNGTAVTALNTTVTAITTGPLSIDANGVLTLEPNTVSGSYSITYEICEKGATPANCDTATATVVVKGTLDAKDDNTYAVQVPGTTVATTVGNVTTNDTLNGTAVTSTNTTVTAITTGPLSIDTNGVLTLDPNTASGSYSIIYEICEKGATPANCDTATVTLIVGQPAIIAVTENTLPINGSIGGTTFSLTNNDTLNGDPAVIKNSNGGIILTPVNVPTGLTLNPDGTVTVKPGTPIGNYEIEYTICEYLNATSNCATIKSYVPVTGAVLQANNDNAGTVDSSKGQSSTTSIFHNDTLNGSIVNPSDVVLSTVVSNPNLILKTDGTIEVKPGTPSGNYELTYQICEALNTSNCSQAVVKITVVNTPPITPLIQLIINNDGVVNVDGINGSLEFINVLDNDLLKGLPINPLDVLITNTPNKYFEFNSDGTVNVKPNTPGGNYSLVYQVCEKANLTNCGTATLSVFVEVPAIAIIKTAVFNDENGSGFANAGETITYKFKVTNTGNVPLTGVMVSDPLPGLVLTGQAIDLEVNESDEHNFIATYKITQNDINKGSISNQATVKGRSNKGVVVEDKSDDENNLEDKPTVLPLNGCVIKVFNAFSPNGDEKNKRFYIQGLECYPDNTVEIYNRWGVLVYNIDNYNNEDRAFVGYSEGRTTIKQSEGLPVGTYFYIVKYKDSGSNSHELSGYLYINK